MTPQVQFGIILGSTVVAFLAGLLIGKSIRMPDHGWKLGVILGSMAMGVSLIALRPIKLGIDLRGGVILIYEVDEQKTTEAAIAQSGGELKKEETKVRMPDLVMALGRRINPSGVSEIVIRPYGDKQVEIIIPDVSESEIALIKNRIRKTGFLKFRIVAHRDRNRYEWELAEATLTSDNPDVRDGKFVRDENDKIIGEWVQLGREDPSEDLPEDELPPLRFDPEQVASMLTREKPGQVEAFVLVDDPRFNVEGRHLRTISEDFDENAQPCVQFQMTSEGSQLFAQLTSTNLPNEAGIRAPLGIIMDEKMLSAPGIKTTISQSGIIEGRFSQSEVDELVGILRAGKLPAVLKENPISQNQISPLLGEDTIRKGAFAIVISVAAVLVFMLVYYRFAGIVACLALLTNLILIVGLMILIKASLSLPGLAGLVLTVGMSVDANVLIFERIREELKRGAALRMAIRNGFGRATSTIVDANLTTLITAVVLYVVGTETIKGFAITLILGILMSMYTAIFCSRVTFDIAERKKWIKSLSMAHILGETNINFVGMRRMAAIVSILVVAISLAAVAARGKNQNLLDIDFTGGTSVQIVLNESIEIGNVRSELSGIAESFSVTEVNPLGYEDDTVYKIDTSLETESELEAKVSELFSGRLSTHSMEFTPPGDAQSAIQRRSRQSLAVKHRSLDGTLLAHAGEPLWLAQAEEDPQAGSADDDKTTPGDAPEGDATTGEATDSESTVASEGATAEQSKTAASGDEDTSSIDAAVFSPSRTAEEFMSQSTITLDQKLSKTAIEKTLITAAEAAGVTVGMQVSNPLWKERQADEGFETWTVKFTSGPEVTNQVLTAMQQRLDATPVFLSSSKIGSKVAGDMQSSALMAIFVSLIGIVGYIWIRFQRVGFGLAAVLALVHDIFITLGAVSLSFYLAPFLGFLMIDEFKISLPIVAAFLTIIGYSLNDTIVVFDRIREVKGKSPELTAEMVNHSINQTLSRTVLTSLTTLIVVLILYVFGGQGIHGFAFALLVGVMVGTYSSIFVASSALLWLIGKPSKNPAARTAKRSVSVS